MSYFQECRQKTKFLLPDGTEISFLAEAPIMAAIARNFANLKLSEVGNQIEPRVITVLNQFRADHPDQLFEVNVKTVSVIFKNFLTIMVVNIIADAGLNLNN